MQDTTATTWLTLAEVGSVAQISLKVLYRECRAGRLRHARIGGRSGPIRVHRDWITAWLEASATPIEVRR
jgi:Helix-turn-helix domain